MARMVEEGLQILKEEEGLPSKRQAPTPLHSYKDDVGVWTIGYGHTAAAGAPIPRDGLKLGSMAEAEQLLLRDLQKYQAMVDRNVKVPLSDEQHSALTIWVYNVGEGAMKGSSLLKKLNKGDYASVPAELSRWNKGTVKGKRVVLAGLVRRRAREGALFAKGTSAPRVRSADAVGARPQGNFGYGLLAKPEILGTGGTIAGAAFSAAASPGPLQIALAGVVIVAAIVVAIYAVKRILAA